MNQRVPRRFVITATTNGSGAATIYFPATDTNVPQRTISGRIHSLTYTKVDFADGVDFTATVDSTGQSVWTDTDINASETVYPLAAGNLGASGAASSLTEVPIILANDRVKIVIGSGGDTKTGTFTLVVE